MICDRLNVFLSLIGVVVQGDEHAPPMTVSLLILVLICDFLWVFDFFVRVTKGEFDQSHVTKPLACRLKLCLTLFIFCTHCRSDLSLQLLIDLRNEKLVEMCSAHRTSHARLDNPLMALEAQKVLAGCENGLGTELKADRALIVIPLCTSNLVSLTNVAFGRAGSH